MVSEYTRSKVRLIQIFLISRALLSVYFGCGRVWCETKINPGGTFELGTHIVGPKIPDLDILFGKIHVDPCRGLDKVPRYMPTKLEQNVRSWKRKWRRLGKGHQEKYSWPVPTTKVRSFESGVEILSQPRDHCKPTVLEPRPPSY